MLHSIPARTFSAIFATPKVSEYTANYKSLQKTTKQTPALPTASAEVNNRQAARLADLLQLKNNVNKCVITKSHKIAKKLSG